MAIVERRDLAWGRELRMICPCVEPSCRGLLIRPLARLLVGHSIRFACGREPTFVKGPLEAR